MATMLTSGCSGSNENNATSSQSSESPKAVSEVESPWKCKTEQDGLGDIYGCTTQAYDSSDTIWTIAIACDSERVTKLRIGGFDTNFDPIIWKTNFTGKAKVRFDSQPIEDWPIIETSDGETFLFYDSKNGSKGQNAGSWKFLSRLSGVESFGFKAKDASGFAQSALFNVSQSDLFITKFASMGCRA